MAHPNLASPFQSEGLKGGGGNGFMPLTVGVYLIKKSPSASPKGFGTSPFSCSATKGGGKEKNLAASAPPPFTEG